MCGCATAHGSWRRASNENTISSYKTFLSEYPRSDYSGEAHRRLAELEWKRTQELDTIAGYDAFVKEYLDSAHGMEARRIRDEKASKRKDAVDSALSRIRSYRIGTTKEHTFLRDHWGLEDLRQGDAGIIGCVRAPGSSRYAIGFVAREGILAIDEEFKDGYASCYDAPKFDETFIFTISNSSISTRIYYSGGGHYDGSIRTDMTGRYHVLCSVLFNQGILESVDCYP
jgi:hypothetical protein